MADFRVGKGAFSNFEDHLNQYKTVGHTARYARASAFKPNSFDRFHQRAVETDITTDGKFSFKEAGKNFLKGLVSPITAMFASITNFLIGAGMLGGGIGLLVATRGMAAPVLVATGLAFGAVELGRTAYKLATAKNGDGLEKAFFDIGLATSAIGLSFVGLKSSLKPLAGHVGLSNEAIAGMSLFQALLKNIQSVPQALLQSWRHLSGKTALGIGSVAATGAVATKADGAISAGKLSETGTSSSPSTSRANAAHADPEVAATQTAKTVSPELEALKMTPEAAAKLLNDQLDLLSPEQITHLIQRFDPADQALASQIMKQLSQFGRMDDFNVIMQQAFETGRPIYAPDDATLAGNLYYLFHNKGRNNFIHPKTGEKIPIPPERWAMAVEQDAVVVLDAKMIHRLKSEPELLQAMKEKNVLFLHPEGFDNGFNPFVQVDDNYWASRLGAMIEQVKAKNGQSGPTDSNIISGVVNREALQVLEQLGVPSDSVRILRNGSVDLATTTPESIVARLNADKLDPKVLGDSSKMIYMMIDPDQGPMLERFIHNPRAAEVYPYQLAMMAKHARLYSARSLGRKMTVLHDEILKKAAAQGIAPDDIYYVLPTKEGEHKSFGLMALIYRQANHIDPKQVVRSPSEIPSGKKTMMVVIDDFNASGETQLAVHRALSKAGHTGPRLSCCIASSETAYAGTLALDYVKPLKETETYRALEALMEGSDAYKYVLGGEENCFSGSNAVIFPWMASDNSAGLIKGLAFCTTLNKIGVQGAVCGQGAVGWKS